MTNQPNAPSLPIYLKSFLPKRWPQRQIGAAAFGILPDTCKINGIIGDRIMSVPKRAVF